MPGNGTFAPTFSGSRSPISASRSPSGCRDGQALGPVVSCNAAAARLLAPNSPSRPCRTRSGAHGSPHRPNVPRSQDEVAARSRAGKARGPTGHDRRLADPLLHGWRGSMPAMPPMPRAAALRPQPPSLERRALRLVRRDEVRPARGARQRARFGVTKNVPGLKDGPSRSPRRSPTAMPRFSAMAPLIPATAK